MVLLCLKPIMSGWGPNSCIIWPPPPSPNVHLPGWPPWFPLLQACGFLLPTCFPHTLKGDSFPGTCTLPISSSRNTLPLDSCIGNPWSITRHQVKRFLAVILTWKPENVIYHSEQAVSIRSRFLNLQMIHVICNGTVSNHIKEKHSRWPLALKHCLHFSGKRQNFNMVAAHIRQWVDIWVCWDDVG